MSEMTHGKLKYREVYDIDRDEFFVIAWIGDRQTGFDMPSPLKFPDALSHHKARTLVLSRCEAYLSSDDYPKPPSDRSDPIWSAENTHFLQHGDANEIAPPL